MNASEANSLRRSSAAQEAIQRGVAMEIQHRVNRAHEPKELRTSVNVAMTENAALAELLVRKGVVTREELLEVTANKLQLEKRAYEERLSDHLGVDVKL